MTAARELLRRARPNGTAVTVDGEPLTSERIKVAIGNAFTEHDAIADEFIVSHGPQTAIGHDMGSGPIAPNEPIVIDLFPRDRESACFADMTRTYVVGTPTDELEEYHRLCHEALQRALADVKPGVEGNSLHVSTCELFQENGQKTSLDKEPGKVLEDDTLIEIAEAHGRKPGQVALRWLLDQPNVAAIPKASSHERRLENFDVFDFDLTDEERGRIDALPKDRREIDPGFAPDWDV